MRGDGTTVRLTPRETALLGLLLAHAGQTVGHAAVWGAACAGSDDVLAVYVGRLRRKLGAEGSMIHTRCDGGRGYALERRRVARPDADSGARVGGGRGGVVG